MARKWKYLRVKRGGKTYKTKVKLYWSKGLQKWVSIPKD